MLADKLLEGYGGFYTSTMESDISDPIAYLNEMCIEAITALQEAAQQYYIGDIIGQSQVIMEGYTDEVLTESVGSRLKQLWGGFKKKVKEIIGKIVLKIKQFISWIKSALVRGKGKMKTDALIKEVKSFDPEIYTQQATRSQSPDNADIDTMNSSDQHRSRQQNPTTIHGTNIKSTSLVAYSGGGVSDQQNPTTIHDINTNQITDREKPKSQIVLYLPGPTITKEVILDAPMKDKNDIVIPNMDRMCELLQNISDLIVDVLSYADIVIGGKNLKIGVQKAIMKGLHTKNNGGKGYAASEKISEYIDMLENPEDDEDARYYSYIAKVPFNDGFPDYVKHDGCYTGPDFASADMVTEMIDYALRTSVTSCEISHETKQSLTKTLNYLNEKYNEKTWLNITVQFNVYLNQFNSMKEDLNNMDVGDDVPDPNKIVSFMYAYISNMVSTASYGITLITKSKHIVDYCVNSIDAAFKNYKGQVPYM